MKTAQDYVLYDKEILSLEWNGREIRNGELTESEMKDTE